jgi:hypothetical protein
LIKSNTPIGSTIIGIGRIVISSFVGSVWPALWVRPFGPT